MILHVEDHPVGLGGYGLLVHKKEELYKHQTSKENDYEENGFKCQSPP